MLCGAIATSIHYGAMYLCIALLGCSPLTGTLSGAALGALCNYVLLYGYGYQSSQPHSAALPRFTVTAALAWLLNAGLFSGFHNLIQLGTWPAQLLTTGLVLCCNLLSYQYLVFRPVPSNSDQWGNP